MLELVVMELLVLNGIVHYHVGFFDVLVDQHEQQYIEWLQHQQHLEHRVTSFQHRTALRFEAQNRLHELHFNA